jgi:hypothetical protein
MGIGKQWRARLLSRLESGFAWLGYTFVNHWGAFERGYRRPSARIALRLRFAFYPLLALVALGWLAWDWNHGRSLASAENAIFDQVIKLRPWEPKPSGKVVVVEIDDCSIEYYRAQGEGGWPWSRQRHADLLDALDRAGVRAVGYDLQFIEPSNSDPLGDATLEAMAAGGNGRFVFGSTRVPAGGGSARSRATTGSKAGNEQCRSKIILAHAGALRRGDTDQSGRGRERHGGGNLII